MSQLGVVTRHPCGHESETTFREDADSSEVWLILNRLERRPCPTCEISAPDIALPTPRTPRRNYRATVRRTDALPEKDEQGQRWESGLCRVCGCSGVPVRFTRLRKPITLSGQHMTRVYDAYACAGPDCVPV